MSSRFDRTSMAALLVWLLAACHSPILWIGELPPDAAVDPHQPPDAPREDASADEAAESGTPPGAHDAGPQTAPPPMSDAPKLAPTGAPSKPMTARDAGATGPADDHDAGSLDPILPEPPKPTRLPTVRGKCPELTRPGTYVFGEPRVRTLSVDIYISPDARNNPGPFAPLILYYHSIGASPAEVVTALGGRPAIDAVTQLGGVVAAFSAKLCATCGLSDELQWYPEDDAVTDQVVACALEQAHIDPRRIHAVGFSAGAMYSLRLAFSRSDYIASVISYSGGVTDPNPPKPQDPSNHVPAMLTYGRVGLDYIALDFPMLTLQWYEKTKALGWYSMLCDHGGAHVIPEDVAVQSLRFMLDHSYKNEPESYAQGVPVVFPSYCTNTPKSR
ncbi:MAG TPA: hypothetical protein VJR89_30875 [Polyangiales bacterium]|nr:hypothetical protein [Polyangiales bacterium]